ncbi:MAG: efflux RND transporter periplasmic adaptor subunit [Oscillospiraceae bacterium]|nr:efflux RND transporter periplasmic adaptor subunit [Oscillospiraceae bacterium]
MMKKLTLIVTALALMLGICACGSDGAGISVQRADQLAAAGQAGDRYAGMVVSENVVEIQRDSSKTVEELYVEVGQEVKAGDKLFSYDSDALELDLEKAQLEVEKMENEQADYTEQLAKLEKQLSRTSNSSTKVRLTLEINTLKTTMMENDYNLASRKQEIEKLQEMLQNVDITTPVDGTIRQIDEEGQTGVYIMVQQSGAYRVQGNINEMSMGGSLMPGARVKIYSRVSDQVWMGTVEQIDTENPVQNDNNMYYGPSDNMTMTSTYPFYVTLDSVDGLLLGQHVYMEVEMQEQAMPGLWIPENFLTEITTDEQTFEMSAKVWVAGSNGKLTQRTVSLGMQDYMTGCYEILSGLAPEDYVADPMNPGCESGAPVTYREAEDFGGGTENQDVAVTAPAGEEENYDIMLPQAEFPEGEIQTGEDAAADVVLPEDGVVAEDNVVAEVTGE